MQSSFTAGCKAGARRQGVENCVTDLFLCLYSYEDTYLAEDRG